MDTTPQPEPSDQPQPAPDPTPAPTQAPTPAPASAAANPLLAGPWPGGWVIAKRSIVDFFTNIVPFLAGLLALVPILVALGIFFVAKGNPAVAVIAFVLGAVGVLALFYVAVCAAAATPLYALARADGRKMSTKEFYQARLRLFWRLTLASLVLVIPIIIGFILLVLPGLIALVYLLPTFALVPFVVAEENLGTMDSVKKAYHLSKPHRGKAYGIMGWFILIGLVIIIPIILIVVAFLAKHPPHQPTSTSSSSNHSNGNSSAGGGAISSIAFAYLYRWIQRQPQ